MVHTPVPQIKSAPPSGFCCDILSLMLVMMDIIGTAGQKPGPPQIQDRTNNGATSPRSKNRTTTPDFHVTLGGGAVGFDANAFDMVTLMFEWGGYAAW